MSDTTTTAAGRDPHSFSVISAWACSWGDDEADGFVAWLEEADGVAAWLARVLEALSGDEDALAAITREVIYSVDDPEVTAEDVRAWTTHRGDVLREAVASALASLNAGG